MQQHDSQLSAAIFRVARLLLLVFIFMPGIFAGDADNGGGLIPFLPEPIPEPANPGEPAEAFENVDPLGQVPMVLLGNGVFNVLGESDVRSGEREPPPPPHTPAKPGALILRWDRYRTLIVIDDSAGLVKGCWIVTLATMPEQIPTARGPIMVARGQVVVAYRGQAYYDKNGILQIDAHRATLSGALGVLWSPDSFSISPDKQVEARDDDPDHDSNSGEVEKEISPETHPADYKKLRWAAQSIVSGII